jgi:hypothetical protein
MNKHCKTQELACGTCDTTAAVAVLVAIVLYAVITVRIGYELYFPLTYCL